MKILNSFKILRQTILLILLLITTPTTLGFSVYRSVGSLNDLHKPSAAAAAHHHHNFTSTHHGFINTYPSSAAAAPQHYANSINHLDHHHQTAPPSCASASIKPILLIHDVTQRHLQVPVINRVAQEVEVAVPDRELYMITLKATGQNPAGRFYLYDTVARRFICVKNEKNSRLVPKIIPTNNTCTYSELPIENGYTQYSVNGNMLDFRKNGSQVMRRRNTAQNRFLRKTLKTCTCTRYDFHERMRAVERRVRRALRLNGGNPVAAAAAAAAAPHHHVRHKHGGGGPQKQAAVQREKATQQLEELATLLELSTPSETEIVQCRSGKVDSRGQQQRRGKVNPKRHRQQQQQQHTAAVSRH